MEEKTKELKPQTKTKSQERGPERVALNLEAVARMEQWMSQIEKEKKGVRITRNDLVNFVLLRHAPVLSEEELTDIGKAHYSELRFYEWALKTVRKAQARGEDLTISMLREQYGIPD